MKIPIFLSTTIICPECQNMIEKLPPGMEEAISNGDLLRCSKCKSWLIVRIEVTKQSFDWMQEDGALPSYTCKCGFIVAIGETECLRCKTSRQ